MTCAGTWTSDSTKWTSDSLSFLKSDPPDVPSWGAMLDQVDRQFDQVDQPEHVRRIRPSGPAFLPGKHHSLTTKWTSDSTKWTSDSTKWTSDSTKWTSGSTKWTSGSTKWTGNSTKWTGNSATCAKGRRASERNSEP